MSELGKDHRRDAEDNRDYARLIIEAARDYHRMEREQRIVALLEGGRLVLRSVVVVRGVHVVLPVGARVHTLSAVPLDERRARSD